MPVALLAALARLFTGTTLKVLLDIAARAVTVFYVGGFGWSLYKTGGFDRLATATGDVASGTGSVVTSVGRVATSTSKVSTDVLLLFGGAALFLILARR